MADVPGVDADDEPSTTEAVDGSDPDDRSPSRWRHWPLVLPVVLLLVAVGWVALRGPDTSDRSAAGPAEAEAEAQVETVAVTSDAPTFASLLELMEASDVVVRATVVGAEHGRWFGDGQDGTRVQSRLVTLRIDDTMAGPAPPSDTILVEEEGWLDDGTPIAVDGAAPSRVGDDGLWFLADGGDPELGAYVVINAQGRYLVNADDSLTGADGPDPLIARLTEFDVGQLTAEIETLSDQLPDP